MSVTSDLPAGIQPGGRVAAWAPRPHRYVVCDVDGTLVGPHDHATDDVVRAVHHAQRAGLAVGIATGRMRGAVDALAAQLRARGPHILHNGAEVRADGATIRSWTLTPAQVDGLLAIAHDERGTYVEIYTEDAYHVSDLDERARPHWEILGRGPAGVLRAAADLADVPVLKATFALFERDRRAVIEGAITELGLLAGTAGSPRTPHLTYVNATHPDADKGAALRVAADHLGLDLGEVAAVGDAANDLSMLAVAGTAIAMGQAPREVRDAAHLVVPSVDDHGVATALDALVDWLGAAAT